MKKYTHILLVFVAMLLMIACTSDNRKLVENDDFSLSVPNTYQNTKGLNGDAVLQMYNPAEEVYMALINEPKESVIDNFKALGFYDDALSPAENYGKYQVNNFTKGMQILEVSEPEVRNINGNKAAAYKVSAIPSGLDTSIFYEITFMEGASDLYMFLQWTIGDHRQQYEASFEETANSFSEK